MSSFISDEPHIRPGRVLKLLFLAWGQEPGTPYSSGCERTEPGDKRQLLLLGAMHLLGSIIASLGWNSKKEYPHGRESQDPAVTQDREDGNGAITEQT